MAAPRSMGATAPPPTSGAPVWTAGSAWAIWMGSGSGPSSGSRFGKDTLGIGNDALVIRLPTDVFTPGFNLLVQGVSYTGGNDRASYLAFGGASSTGLGAPSFQADQHRRADGRPLRAAPHSRPPCGSPPPPSLPTSRPCCPACSGSRCPISPRPSWRVSDPGARTLPRASILRRGPLGVKASYVWNPDRFRRAPVPTPNQTEVERENITHHLRGEPASFQSGVGRQNYVQDSADSKPPIRATRQYGVRRRCAGRHPPDRRSLRLPLGRHQQPELLFRRGSGADPLAGCGAVRAPEPARGTARRRPRRWPICGGGLSSRIGLSQQISFRDGRPTRARSERA